jgi:hypothetical protein
MRAARRDASRAGELARGFRLVRRFPARAEPWSLDVHAVARTGRAPQCSGARPRSVPRRVRGMSCAPAAPERPPSLRGSSLSVPLAGRAEENRQCQRTCWHSQWALDAARLMPPMPHTSAGLPSIRGITAALMTLLGAPFAIVTKSYRSLTGGYVAMNGVMNVYMRANLQQHILHPALHVFEHRYASQHSDACWAWRSDDDAGRGCDGDVRRHAVRPSAHVWFAVGWE